MKSHAFARQTTLSTSISVSTVPVDIRESRFTFGGVQYPGHACGLVLCRDDHLSHPLHPSLTHSLLGFLGRVSTSAISVAITWTCTLVEGTEWPGV